MKPSDECNLPDTYTTLQRLWDVISDKHSVNQVDRQLILLDTFLSVTEDSVKVADLQLLSKVMGFLIGRIEVNARYRKPFQRIIDLLKLPPKMEKSSDELDYKLYIVELFTSLGYFLLQTKNNELKSQILEIVQRFFLTKRVSQSNLIPVKTCIRSIEVSEFVDCLADFISIADEELYLWTVHTAFQICLISELCCWTLLTKGVIESLLVRLTMAEDIERSEVLDVTYQLLWKLLNCTHHPEDWLKIPGPSRLALRSLRYTLREEALTHSHPGRHYKGLNSIAALTLKMMHIFPNADYIFSGLIEDITFSATLTEVSQENITLFPYFKNELDYLQFKKLMLACLSLSPISNLSIVIFEQYKVAECLVAMLSGGTTCGSAVSWCPENTVDLFRCALPVVCALFDNLQQGFIVAGLMKRLIMFIEVHYLGEKNLPDDLAHIVVKTVLSICSRKVNATATHDALREARSVPVLLELCEIILKPGSSLTMRSQSMLFYSLCVLTTLMENRTELQHEHGKISFYIVTTLYQRILKPLPTDSLIDNRLTVAVSNFAWEVLVWNRENVLKFVSTGEIFSHIDILERGPFSVQLVYLSMLVDLCEYHQSVPYLVSWRGREGVKLLSVLCKIWRTEEERLRVPRSENGCISDIERPLMGENQMKLSKQEQSKTVSVFDVFGSARPKIYAIVQLLHRYKEVTELCEEHYKLGYNKVPFEDQITLQLIEAYLPLKMGEIWWEIRNKQESVLPLDRYLAETLADRYLNWSLYVQRAQRCIVGERNAQLRCEEQEYYSMLHSSHLTLVLEALREVLAIARTADRQLLLLAHQRHHECIEASRANVDADVRLAYPRDIHVILVNSKADIVQQNEPGHGTVDRQSVVT